MTISRARWTRLAASAMAVGLLAGMSIGCGKGGPEQGAAGTAPKQGVMSGEVVLDGEPLAGAVITLNGTSKGTVGARIQSGPDGRFRWEGTTGTYEIVVSQDGKDLLSQTVTIKEGSDNPPVKLEAKSP